jgi:ornithine carbamoyltransferase
LAKNKFNLDKVLDWSARYDQSRAVREMAIAFGAKVPLQQPEDQQLPKNLSDLIKKAAIDTNNIPASDSIKKAAVDANNIPGSNTVNKSSQPPDSNITPATLKPGL